MRHFHFLLLLVCVIPFFATAQAADNHFELGKSAIKQGAYYDGMFMFNLVINSNPSNAAAYHNRAICREGVNDYPGAIYDYSQAIYYRPGEKVHYLSRGKVYAEMKDWEKALNDYSTVISLDPRDFEAYELRAGLFLHTGRYEEAAKDITALIKKNATDDVAYMHLLRGETYAKMGEYSRALSDFNTALKKEPDLGEVYLERAKANYELKKLKNACADLNKATELGYNNNQLKRQFGCN